MEEFIEQFYSNYAWTENYLEITADTDDIYFLIECRYEYNEYPKTIRLKDPFKEEELLTEEEEITKQLDEMDMDNLIEKS